MRLLNQFFVTPAAKREFVFFMGGVAFQAGMIYQLKKQVDANAKFFAGSSLEAQNMSHTRLGKNPTTSDLYGAFERKMLFDFPGFRPS